MCLSTALYTFVHIKLFQLYLKGYSRICVKSSTKLYNLCNSHTSRNKTSCRMESCESSWHFHQNFILCFKSGRLHTQMLLVRMHFEICHCFSSVSLTWYFLRSSWTVEWIFYELSLFSCKKHMQSLLHDHPSLQGTLHLCSPSV